MKWPGSTKWLNFFRREHTGAVLIFLLAALIVAVPRLWGNYQEPEKMHFRADSLEVRALMEEQQDYLDSFYNKNHKRRQNLYRTSEKDLLDAGLSHEAAGKIAGIAKSKRFFKGYKELSLETGIDSETLAKFISPRSFFPTKKFQEKDEDNENYTLEVNAADTNDFKRLRGIGSKTANRLVNYRRKLGGFFSLNQLLEVRYVDTIVIRSLFERFSLNAGLIEKIVLNETPESQLEAHPYISKTQARLITAYTRENGKLSKERFLKLPGFNEFERMRLLPYLDFR